MDGANAYFPTQAGSKGFLDGRFHSLRCFFVSKCVNEGVPERVTMEIVGHEDSGLVRHYYHLNDQEAKEQISRLT
jgi:integrase